MRRFSSTTPRLFSGKRSLLAQQNQNRIRWCATVGGTATTTAAAAAAHPPPQAKAPPASKEKKKKKGSYNDWDFTFEADADMVKMMIVGFFTVTATTAAIAVNQRRAAKQDVLNDFIENRIVSNDDDDGVDPSGEAFVNSVVHVHGPIEVSGTAAHDPMLGVEVGDGVLRLKRTVEMYQWVESVENDIDDKGKTYTYTKGWNTRRLKTHSIKKVNPAFPKLGTVQESSALELVASTISGATVRLLLGKDFLGRLEDWTDVPVRINDNSSSVAATKNLQFNEDQMGFYTTGGDPSNPQIGDVRVRYECIKPGIHTVVGKYSLPRNLLGYEKRSGNMELQPFKASFDGEPKATLTQKFRAMRNLTKSCDRVEYLVFGQLPVEFALVKRGAEKKETSLSNHRVNCFFNAEAVYASCLGSCVLGVWAMALPVGIFSGIAQLAFAVPVGFGIATTCRAQAAWEIEHVDVTGNTPQPKKRGADVVL